MLSFDELTSARRSLQSFCLLHVPSLLRLRSGISFKLFANDKSLAHSRRVRHLTTTATCLSSLLDCPPRFYPDEFEDVSPLFRTFAKKALVRRNWKSEGSAQIYCRCRALPLVIKFSRVYDEIIEEHVLRIMAQLKRRPDRFGIGEADPELQNERDWSPPNAFHTYWTLDILSQLEEKFPKEYTQSSAYKGLNLPLKREGMLLWTRQRLGYEIGLHSEPKSSVLDTDQLAWTLAIFLRFDGNFHSDLAKQDLIKQAFKCLFSTQNNVGTWPHYKPLFHYRDAGNAYCYVFETFAVLLQCALKERAEMEVIHSLLKPYCKNLVDLWGYAVSTQIPLEPDGQIIGWSSGHRINDPGAAESWATASVFSYAQALRKLIGMWCGEEALRNLRRPRIQHTTKEAIKEMASRGKTWRPGKASVSEQLWTMFINPVRMHECTDKLEPDSQPIEKEQARSAILFGPPGTSKTTLVRSLADVIGWKYVELHASHFVAEGLALVQKTADTIFRQLSELDHAVVLFDEIDELVRERDMEKDAFGRFLTTSMLPKLAELWDARKILYFVATNHINYFDSAIIRSHRFDALVLVSPPSFRSKIEELERLLSKVHDLPGVRFDIKERDIQNRLEAIEKAMPGDDEGAPSKETIERREQWREGELNHEFNLAKLALLRWDELNELAYRLAMTLKAKSRTPRKLGRLVLEEALSRVADSEWRKNKSYVDYLRDTRSERRDYQMMRVWEVVGRTKKVIPDLILKNHRRWLAKPVDSAEDIKVEGFGLRFQVGGRVAITPAVSK
jgi:ATPase family associated with various cellular activities (AAA)